MIDFLFFDQPLAERFQQVVIDMHGESSIEKTSEGGVQVRVRQASLDEDQLAELDELYDDMFFIEQASLVEEQGGLADSCGVQLQLSTGEYTNVMMEPSMMNRLLSVLSPEEVQALFAKVADAVENPQNHQCGTCHLLYDKFGIRHNP